MKQDITTDFKSHSLLFRGDVHDSGHGVSLLANNCSGTSYMNNDGVGNPHKNNDGFIQNGNSWLRCQRLSVARRC